MITDAELLKRCRAVLWPDNDPDQEWNADTINELAELLAYPRHESTKQKGLFFWAEPVNPLDNSPSACWHVVGQAEGYPATEAFDDWLKYQHDADDIAQKIATGEL